MSRTPLVVIPALAAAGALALLAVQEVDGGTRKLTERRECGDRCSSTGRAPRPHRVDAGSSPAAGSVPLSRPGRRSASYRVDWRRRYLGEHRHVQRLLRRLERVRHVQAHVETLPPHYSDWLCIHRYEGAWDASTGNGYYGGLQMDMEFQHDHGAALLASKGTADHWTPLEQMWAAEDAWRTRGFEPWPTTARLCGLL